MSTAAAPNQSLPSLSPAPAPVRSELSGLSGVLIVLCGVLLPTITTVVEALSHMCAEVLFDPLPTVAHLFAVATVPLASLLSLWALRRRDGAHLDAILFAQAFAIAVSGVYALLFAPIVPIAVVAIAAGGLGLLPLSPLLSFLAGLGALFALLRLRAGLGRAPRRRLGWGGFAAGVATLVALNIPALVTRVLLVRAASEDPAVSRSAVSWLRRIGEQDLLVRAAAGRARGEVDVVGAALDVVAPIPRDKTREIYFRVTGRPIEDEAPRRLGGNPLNPPDRRWDGKQGGDEVGVVALPGLALASSRFDGTVDARAALAYVEWTFELRNEAPMPREARAELALPPGGVVSRVTLWIDGVEREAAFAGRDVTRRAYERVVRARRDPILVTTSAPDRVLVQCFPVPPNGGLIKARIGITAPLQLARLGAGTLGLPYLTQRNFAVPAGVTHAIWIASKSPFAAPAAPLVREQVAGGEEVRGKLAEPAAPAPFAAVTVERPATTAAWTPERTSKDVASRPGIIRQTLQSVAAEPPSRLIVVVDGGGAMKHAGPVVGEVLKALPAGVPVAIEIAGDSVIDLLGGVVRAGDPAADADHVAGVLRSIDFAGGTDSLPALAAAWDLATVAPRGAVLWIHGPQSMLVAPTGELRQRLERRKDGPTVYTYAAVGGENRLLADLADLPSFRAVPRYLPGNADLQPFVAGLVGAVPRIVATRTRVADAPPTARDDVETSDHLARLWAAEQIDALLHPVSGAAASPSDRTQALALAASYHLVTAVSGAVVLDSQAATDAVAGSDSPQADVPTVPEPETWALLALVAVILALAVRGRRRILAGATLAS